MRACLALLLLSSVLGCGDATGVLVEVRSDLSVPAELDALHFVVTSDAGRSIDETYAIDSAWPHSLTIVPGSDREVRLTITVTGLKGGEFRVRRVIEARFERGRTRVVEVELPRDCLMVRCANGIDCARGICVSGASDGGLADAMTDGSLADAMMDGGLGDAMMDGGLGDATMDGGLGDAMTDGGLGDAMTDGGLGDAMTDGGLADAMMDAGLPDAMM
ncbi:MAG: hypothetical protein OEY14_07370, partial [Myxococcales bacterium]|nr:hypothetical protein [Myxococcales bacterium]